MGIGIIYIRELCAQIWLRKLYMQKNSTNKKILHAKFGSRLYIQKNSINKKILRANFSNSKNSTNRKLLCIKFGLGLYIQRIMHVKFGIVKVLK